MRGDFTEFLVAGKTGIPLEKIANPAQTFLDQRCNAGKIGWVCNKRRIRVIVPAMKQFLLPALVVLLLASMATGQGYPKPQVPSAAGQPAPDFTLKDQDGKDFHLADQHSHWVLLYFYRGYW